MASTGRAKSRAPFIKALCDQEIMKYLPLLIAIIFSNHAFGEQCLSHEELEIDRQEIYKVLETSQSCTKDSDCGLLSLGCPIGCATPVNKEHSVKITSMAEDYHSKRCHRCEYKCKRFTSAICVENQCVQK